MENENGGCSCSELPGGAKTSLARSAEISPEAVEMIRSAPVPAKFWAAVNEVVTNVGMQFGSQLDNTLAFPRINKTPASMPLAQASFQPVETPVVPITAPSYEMSTAGASVDPFDPTSLTFDLSPVTQIAPVLHDTALSPLALVGAPQVLAQRRDDESDQTDAPFPGPLPQEEPEWVGDEEKKVIGESLTYEHEGMVCMDRMFEITRKGKLITKEQFIGHALFWRVEDYTGMLAQVAKKTCVYLTEVIHILRYQVRQKFHKKVRYCEGGPPRVLFEFPITEPYWEKLHHLEKLNYGSPQICFIQTTSEAAQTWIKNYIKEYGPDIIDLGER
jgi:hypothetical protein